MATKLTLRMDEEIIEGAKAYARQHKTSLSQLISRYFQSLNIAKRSGVGISPVVKEISGLLPRGFKRDQALRGYRQHLKKKYQK